MLPQEAIEEFKQIYLDLYGEVLSDAEARAKAENLVRLYEAVYGPEPTPFPGPIPKPAGPRRRRRASLRSLQQTSSIV
jgi:hypothetical protein